MLFFGSCLVIYVWGYRSGPLSGRYICLSENIMVWYLRVRIFLRRWSRFFLLPFLQICMFVCFLQCEYVLWVCKLWRVGCEFFNISSMFVRIVFSVWLLCMVGCIMCMFRLYRQLRQYVNMYACLFGYLIDIASSVLWIAISSTQKHVCSPSDLFEICMSILVDYIFQS